MWGKETEKALYLGTYRARFECYGFGSQFFCFLFEGRHFTMLTARALNYSAFCMKSKWVSQQIQEIVSFEDLHSSFSYRKKKEEMFKVWVGFRQFFEEEEEISVPCSASHLPSLELASLYLRAEFCPINSLKDLFISKKKTLFPHAEWF